MLVKEQQRGTEKQNKKRKVKVTKMKSEKKSGVRITDVRVRMSNRSEDSKSKIVGTASITIEDAFVIHDIKIIDGEKGLFIAMPSRKITAQDGTEKWVDTAHPINAEVREQVTNTVLSAYTNMSLKTK